MIQNVEQAAVNVSVSELCARLDIPRSAVYRARDRAAKAAAVTTPAPETASQPAAVAGYVASGSVAGYMQPDHSPAAEALMVAEVALTSQAAVGAVLTATLPSVTASVAASPALVEGSEHVTAEAMALIVRPQSAQTAETADCVSPEVVVPARRPSPPRSLSTEERAHVLAVLNSEPFQNSSAREVYAALLDDGTFLCSVRSMYRILEANEAVKERRNQLRHPTYARPQLEATAPNQVWSWDITKLRGLATWCYYYLYIMLDLYSRYVVGWMIAERENAELAERFIAETYTKQQIEPNQLTIHADRGSPMVALSTAQLLTRLGVEESHSRPRTSDDNAYSESQIKTLKYHWTYPGRFESLAEARTWAQSFFGWYNNEHRHTSINLLTPADVHYGRAEAVLQQRQAVLELAYQAHPERFVKGVPSAGRLPSAVWINPPTAATSDDGT